MSSDSLHFNNNLNLNHKVASDSDPTLTKKSTLRVSQEKALVYEKKVDVCQEEKKIQEAATPAISSNYNQPLLYPVSEQAKKNRQETVSKTSSGSKKRGTKAIDEAEVIKTLTPRETLDELVMQEAYELVSNQITTWQEAKKKLKGSKPENKIRDSSTSTPFIRSDSKDDIGKSVKINKLTALFYAWDGKLKELKGTESPNLELLNFVSRERTKLLTSISIRKEREEKPVDALKNGLQCITLKKEKLLQHDHPTKFKCIATETGTTVTEYPKATRNGDPTWHTLGKTIKKTLKDKIKLKVTSDIKKRAEGDYIGPFAFDLKFALDNFQLLLDRSKQNTDNLKVQNTVISQLVEYLDGYVKGFLSKDTFMVNKYWEFAKGLYYCSEEAHEKKNNKAQELEHAHVAILQDFLKSICDHLEKEVKVVHEKNKQGTQQLSAEKVESVTDLTSAYLMKLIKMHKNLSFRRFNDLFFAHSTFLSRLCYALDKFQEHSQQEQAQAVVKGALSPAVTLLETKKHRNAQANHLSFEDRKKAHRSIKEEVGIVRSLMADCKYDIGEFQCAHVVPFPALFARREQGQQQKAPQNTAELTRASVSLTYMTSSKEEREESIKKDIDAIFTFFKENPVDYIDNVLDLIMKISLEEVSHTVHLPTIFNQEVDGASEKDIAIENPNSAESSLLNKNKAINEKTRAKNNRSTSASNESVAMTTASTATPVISTISTSSSISSTSTPTASVVSQVIQPAENSMSTAMHAITRRIKDLVNLPITFTNKILGFVYSTRTSASNESVTTTAASTSTPLISTDSSSSVSTVTDLSEEIASAVQVDGTLYSDKVYKYILSLSLFSMIQQRKPLSVLQVMQHEESYIVGVKRSITKKITNLVKQPKTLTNMILGVAYCNVFFGLKNSEALQNSNFTKEDEAFTNALLKLQEWVAKETDSNV